MRHRADNGTRFFFAPFGQRFFVVRRPKGFAVVEFFHLLYRSLLGVSFFPFGIHHPINILCGLVVSHGIQGPNYFLDVFAVAAASVLFLDAVGQLPGFYDEPLRINKLICDAIE